MVFFSDGRRWHNPTETPHVAQFFNDDASLVSAVGNFMNDADEAIVIAFPDRRRNIERVLDASGFSTAFDSRKTYRALDALGTASALMEARDTPNAGRFFEIIGTVVTRAAEGDRVVRVYDETGAALLERWNDAASEKLEECWTYLQRAHLFSLLCGFFTPRLDARSLSGIAALHQKSVLSGTTARTPLPSSIFPRPRRVGAWRDRSRK